MKPRTPTPSLFPVQNVFGSEPTETSSGNNSEVLEPEMSKPTRQKPEQVLSLSLVERPLDAKKKERRKIPDEAFIGNKSYGAGTRSYNRSSAHSQLAEERQRITEEYLAGKMTFEPLELLCYCGGMFSTGYQWISPPGVGHPIHTEELEQFNHEIKASKQNRRLANTHPTNKKSRSFRSRPMRQPKTKQ